MDHLLLPKPVYHQIVKTIGSLPAETGGIFAIMGTSITDFYFDIEASTSQHCYTPNTERITEQVNRWLREDGKSLGGYIHSHPNSLTTLSCMDVRAAMANMLLNHLPVLFMGIMCQNRLYFYKVIHDPQKDIPIVESCSYEITE